jgi:hypothetical protein
LAAFLDRIAFTEEPLFAAEDVERNAEPRALHPESPTTSAHATIALGQIGWCADPFEALRHSLAVFFSLAVLQPAYLVLCVVGWNRPFPVIVVITALLGVVGVGCWRLWAVDAFSLRLSSIARVRHLFIGRWLASEEEMAREKQQRKNP